jgi:hypothetical protein
LTSDPESARKCFYQKFIGVTISGTGLADVRAGRGQLLERRPDGAGPACYVAASAGER